MFAPLTASCLALALLVVGLWRAGRRLLPSVVVAMHALVSITILFVHQSAHILEAPAARWIAALPGQIEIDPNTRRHLALIPSAEGLPGLESDRDYTIYKSVVRCRQWLKSSKLPAGSIEIKEETLISRAGKFGFSAGGALCLFRYQRPVSPAEIQLAVIRSQKDGRSIPDSRIYH